MSDISPTNPSPPNHGVNPVQGQKAYRAAASTATSATPTDHVELSDEATTASDALSNLNSLPDVRLDKVESAKARLAELDNPAVFDAILNNGEFLDDIQG